MSLFNKKKVIVEKVENQDKTSFFMNYIKVQKQKDFVSECMQEFNSDYDIFVVINTNVIYNDPKIKIEEKVNLIKKELDGQEIRYQEVITKKDNEVKVFGFPIKRPDKVNSYQIGIILSPGEIHKLKEIVDNVNHFCYVNCDKIEKEVMFHKFGEVRGDYEDLNQVFELCLYIDYNLKRVCINCSQRHVKFTEEKINRIVKKYN